MTLQQQPPASSLLTDSIDSDVLVGRKLMARFVIGKFVAGGSYGRFHLGTETKTSQPVAIKLEKKDMPQPQLHLEFGYYRSLGNIRFIPKIHLLTGIDEWNALVMELLGPSLGKMHQKCGNAFGIQTTTQLMIQLLTIFEYIHEHGILYRDVKPDNFIFGVPNSDKWCTVCLIDLGFCKKYVNENNDHIEFQIGKPLTGTARYVSVNNHAGRELSRRDDLEAMLYMVVFLHKGELPWQGVPATEMREKYKQIALIKFQLKPHELCKDMPPEYTDFLTHIKKLEFDQRPLYRQNIANFRNVLTRMGASMEDHNYDWDKAHNPKKVKLGTGTPMTTQ